DVFYFSAQHEEMPMNANTLSGTYGSASSDQAGHAEVGAPPDSGNIGRDHLREDVQRLRRDVAGLTNTLTRLASQVGDEAAGTLRSAKHSLSAQVSSAADAVADVSSDLASSCPAWDSTQTRAAYSCPAERSR